MCHRMDFQILESQIRVSLRQSLVVEGAGVTTGEGSGGSTSWGVPRATVAIFIFILVIITIALEQKNISRLSSHSNGLDCLVSSPLQSQYPASSLKITSSHSRSKLVSKSPEHVAPRQIHELESGCEGFVVLSVSTFAAGVEDRGAAVEVSVCCGGNVVEGAAVVVPFGGVAAAVVGTLMVVVVGTFVVVASGALAAVVVGTFVVVASGALAGGCCLW